MLMRVLRPSLPLPLPPPPLVLRQSPVPHGARTGPRARALSRALLTCGRAHTSSGGGAARRRRRGADRRDAAGKRRVTRRLF